MPAIQIHGNGILPMCFIFNFFLTRNKTLRYVSELILLAGILFAGNVAYILGLALFLLYVLIGVALNKKKSGYFRLAVIFLICLFFIFFVIYCFWQLEIKSEYSNLIRLSQAKVLLSDSYILIGKGLGHSVKTDGILSDYNGSLYFELQTLYILNQIGLCGLLMNYALIFFGLRKASQLSVILFLIYLVYSFWNPYCFDSTEMMVLCVLVNAEYKQNKIINNKVCIEHNNV